MFWGLFLHQRIKILKALHFFWDFVPPQKESHHLILSSCIPHTSLTSNPLPDSLSLPRDCLLFNLAPSSHPFQCCPLALHSSFLCKVRFFCRCQQGQHTHETLLDLHFMNQKAASYSLYSHSSFKNFFSSPSPSHLFYFPIYFCLIKTSYFFSCFYFLLLKLPFSYLFSS